LSIAIDNLQLGGVSIPIGVCLFFMMYPALLNLSWDELKKAALYPKPIFVTLFSNWFVAPLVGAGLAYLIIRDTQQQQLVLSVILLSSSPCTAMVLVWGMLAEGNQEQNVIITSINTVTIMFLYAPVVSLLTGMQNIDINRLALFASVAIFIGGPLLVGLLSKQLLLRVKGKEWFEHRYLPVFTKLSVVALLLTLIVLFALNGSVIMENSLDLLLVSAPLLLAFLLVVGFNIVAAKIIGLAYREAVITVIIGSSSHFEIAIATAVGMFGVGSKV
jgi:ACR3 family arsenite transporter